MTMSVPARVKTLDAIWMTDELSVLFTLSISFVKRLINSPCCRLSKYEIGKRWNCLKRSSRNSYTVFCAIPTIQKFCKNIANEWQRKTNIKATSTFPKPSISLVTMKWSMDMPTMYGPSRLRPELVTTMRMTSVSILFWLDRYCQIRFNDATIFFVQYFLFFFDGFSVCFVLY